MGRRRALVSCLGVAGNSGSKPGLWNLQSSPRGVHTSHFSGRVSQLSVPVSFHPRRSVAAGESNVTVPLYHYMDTIDACILNKCLIRHLDTIACQWTTSSASVKPFLHNTNIQLVTWRNTFSICYTGRRAGWAPWGLSPSCA